jgi:amino acid transporter
MFNKSDATVSVQHVAGLFQRIGWISFWVQVVLGVIAIVTLFFANSFRSSPTASIESGISFGLFCAFLGLLLLAISIFFSFRYTRISRQLRLSEPEARPRKAEVVQALKLGITVCLAGTLLTLVSANAVVGGLASKASRLASPLGGLTGQQSDFVNTLDMFTVQAIMLILLALFVGVVAQLWLLSQMFRPSQQR